MENNWFTHNVHTVPGSKQNQVTGYMADGSLKVKIKAKPIEGKANKELIKYLSDLLGIKEDEIEISSGQSSRNKIVRILNVDAALLRKKLFG